MPRQDVSSGVPSVFAVQRSTDEQNLRKHTQTPQTTNARLITGKHVAHVSVNEF